MKCIQLNLNTQIEDYIASSQGGEKTLKNIIYGTKRMAFDQL